MDDVSKPERPPRRAARGHRWEKVELRPYKEDERALFKAVTRQVLFSDPELAGELRYFEVAPGGFSTLERHQHMHAVMVLRGSGTCLVGEDIYDIKLHDLVTVPPFTWHQFRAAPNEPLGFLCMVDALRDKPVLPSREDMVELRRNKKVNAFLEGNAQSGR